MDNDPQVLTIAETAAVLRVSNATVLRMLKEGRLQGYTRPGFGRVTKASIEALLGGPIDLSAIVGETV